LQDNKFILIKFIYSSIPNQISVFQYSSVPFVFR
jgi:hypothetical protein